MSASATLSILDFQYSENYRKYQVQKFGGIKFVTFSKLGNCTIVMLTVGSKKNFYQNYEDYSSIQPDAVSIKKSNGANLLRVNLSFAINPHPPVGPTQLSRQTIEHLPRGITFLQVIIEE